MNTRTRSRSARFRRLSLEPLESRHLLAVTLDLTSTDPMVGGDLSIVPASEGNVSNTSGNPAGQLIHESEMIMDVLFTRAK